MRAMRPAKISTPGLLWVGLLLGFTLAIHVAPVKAWAAKADTKEQAAMTACLAGEYNKGVALLAELYVKTRNPIYLFNQGRCFEQNGKYEEAIVRFREFQRKNADAGRSPDVQAEKHIADCQAFLDKQKAPTPTSSLPEARREMEPMPTVIPAAIPVVVSTSSAPDAEMLATPTQPTPEPEGENAPLYKKWWFWTSIGAAVAAGSVTAFLLARRSPDSCDGLGMKCVGVK
jgi:hypothetical protein